jgi:anti-sigma regulatory factor (Ser/Thr protein kinase)
MTGGQRRPAGTLDQTFDADTLADLRKAVLAAAAAVGLPEDRAAEAMFAVHELAANAVRHGGGAGRAQLDVTAGSLRCQVSDTGPGGPGCYAGTGGADSAPPWPFQPGHGLWLVQSVADHLSIESHPHGSEVTVAFRLPDPPGCTAGE